MQSIDAPSLVVVLAAALVLMSLWSVIALVLLRRCAQVLDEVVTLITEQQARERQRPWPSRVS